MFWSSDQPQSSSSESNEQQEPFPGTQCGQQNSAQKVVDSVNYLSETVTNISAKPSKMIGSWVADQINPSYWVPNARIQHCGKCEKEFESIENQPEYLSNFCASIKIVFLIDLIRSEEQNKSKSS